MTDPCRELELKQSDLVKLFKSDFSMVTKKELC